MPLVLSLLDQIYTSRRQMNVLTGAVRRQLDEVRNAILKLLDQPRRRATAAWVRIGVSLRLHSAS